VFVSIRSAIIVIGFGTAPLCVLTLGAQTGALRAGAAKVDITPDASALPLGAYTTIRDHIYARAIVFDNGHNRVALIGTDTANAGLTKEDASTISTEVCKILDVPPENVLMTQTHNHNGIFGGSGPTRPANMVAEVNRIRDGIIEAARQAKANLQPARIGFGTGELDINANSNTPKALRGTQEANAEYPTVKTLAVIKVESLTGDLIAVYMNYAMTATTTYMSGEISGEAPGAAERYIEHRYGSKAVAIWSSGAARDQGPRYATKSSIANLKFGAIQKAHNLPPGDIGNVLLLGMFDGDPAAYNTPVPPMLLEEGHRIIDSEGFFAAEETIWVMNHITRMLSDVEISSVQKDLSCPARRRLDNTFSGKEGQYEDSPTPATIQIGAFVIGDIALTHSSGDPYSKIGEEVKKLSKFPNTAFVSGSSLSKAPYGDRVNYIPTDEAFEREPTSMPVLSSTLKPGCAETGIENGIAGLLQGVSNKP